uniref:Uncharacterized protein n=1 Tax=Candidatus Kentrum sp. TUN TaxID=2126343 RepID=A0A450ZAF1_9GAMM|nr:MAG: hypothetical protein BECKTUN1418E_GA0071001_100420 [Candidatus Kentron sp. TUN]VFK50979.1 MAG: hypothetical protein BECKTUN1418D_GA0071000_100411 [Candidatus Kentron sp. TUN]VFK51955.1 MAG: hypothetical protein BECKTUN1418F_GA0071002_100420 [Candidatus Kentron sp. TUN]
MSVDIVNKFVGIKAISFATFFLVFFVCFGKSLLLDGKSSYLSIPHNEQIDYLEKNKTFTIEALFRNK